MTTQSSNAPAERPRGPPAARLARTAQGWTLTAEADSVAAPAAPGIVPALENGIAIVDYVNGCAPSMPSLVEVSAALGISRSHCHALLKTLVYFGWLRFDEPTKSYGLDGGLLGAASSLLNMPELDAIRPILGELAAAVDLPIVLTEPVADGGFVVVERVNGAPPLQISYPIGHRFPHDAAAQMRAYLAWQQPGQIRSALARHLPRRFTEVTVVDRRGVLAELEATRHRGYARSVGEVTDGVMALALPIFDRTGRVIFIVHALSLVDDLMAREVHVAATMVAAVAQIHERIGGNVPSGFGGDGAGGGLRK